MIKHIISTAAVLIIGAIVASKYNRYYGQQGQEGFSGTDDAPYAPDESDEEDSAYIQEKMAEYRKRHLVKSK